MVRNNKMMESLRVAMPNGLRVAMFKGLVFAVLLLVLAACSSADGDAAPVTIRADKSSTVYVVDGADLNEHYRQSQAAERMGRDYMAYRLEQVKSQIYSHYCEKGVRDV